MSNINSNAHTDYEKRISSNVRNHNLGSFERVWVVGAVNGKAELFQKYVTKL